MNQSRAAADGVSQQPQVANGSVAEDFSEGRRSPRRAFCDRLERVFGLLQRA